MTLFKHTRISSRPPTSTPETRRSGQVLIFIVMAVVVLCFVVLYNVDLHRILHIKSRAQNAGDAAALMAARWQGITLNLIGDLNIAHAAALAETASDTAGSITGMQARLAFVGPMVALMGAQQAAKNNGVYVHAAFTRRMHDHADTVRHDYPFAVGTDGQPAFPQPFADAWTEYADMLDAIADHGIAAAPDNARLYSDIEGGHLLLTPAFYRAIAGRTWCWFYHHAPGLLEAYHNFPPCWWPPLPALPEPQAGNSEVFGLGLRAFTTTLSPDVGTNAIQALASDRLDYQGIVTGAMDLAATWYVYDETRWTEWEAMATGAPDYFPATGVLRPPYDVTGADAVIRIEATADRLTPGPAGSTASNTITWTAAAKPFGSLDGELRPDAWSFVLPAFREVRLIPVNSASGPSGGAFNLGWRTHIEQHLTGYMNAGPSNSACWYCGQLLRWEDASFRQQGIDWLAANSAWCVETGPGPGGGAGGGSSKAH